MGLGEFLILAFTLIFFGAMLAIVSSGINSAKQEPKKDIKTESDSSKEDFDKKAS